MKELRTEAALRCLNKNEKSRDSPVLHCGRCSVCSSPKMLLLAEVALILPAFQKGESSGPALFSHSPKLAAKQIEETR